MITHPNTQEKIRILSNTYQMLGFWQTFKKVVVYSLQGGPRDTFDEKFGVSTSEAVDTLAAGIEDADARALAVKYVATPEPVMRHILEKSTAGQPLEDFSFVDLGSGKGRTLIMASHFAFREVIGVELSPQHCRVAEENVERFLQGDHDPLCSKIRVVCANAMDFRFPDGPVLVYMYRPFLSSVVQAVADNLHRFQAETGHRVLLAYSCPMEEGVLSRHPSFHQVEEYQTISVEQSWGLWECRVEAN